MATLSNTTRAFGALTINISPAEPCWRLVHDGTNIIADPFEVTTHATTMTKYPLFCADTKEECAAEITRLNLAPRHPTPAPHSE